MEKRGCKIGIDLDGTLAAYQEELVRFNNEKYKTSHKLRDAKRDDCYDLLGGNMISRALKLGKFYRHTDSLRSIKPLKDAVKAIRKLKREGYELFIVTSRFRGFSKKTKEWLDRNFGEGAFSKVIHSNMLSSYATRFKTRNYLGQNPDLVIEDSPHAAMNCAKKGIPVLLLDYSWNKTVKDPRITKAKGWNEIIRKIKCMSADKKPLLTPKILNNHHVAQP